MSAQKNWLNKMAEKGYRLINTDKLLYEFEECKKGQFQYMVEFIGQKSKESAADYCNFLEDIGHKVFFKNINLNYLFGKVKYRPWAEKGGRIATNTTTFNRELLIVEKVNDGKSLELHTSYEDKMEYFKNLRNPWLYLLLIFAVFGIFARSIMFGAMALMVLIPVIVYQAEIMKIRRNAITKEW